MKLSTHLSRHSRPDARTVNDWSTTDCQYASRLLQWQARGGTLRASQEVWLTSYLADLQSPPERP